MTEEIANRMGLDTLKTSSLWVDQVLIEVNIAILHSFQVRIGINRFLSTFPISHCSPEQPRIGT